MTRKSYTTLYQTSWDTIHKSGSIIDWVTLVTDLEDLQTTFAVVSRWELNYDSDGPGTGTANEGLAFPSAFQLLIQLHTFLLDKGFLLIYLFITLKVSKQTSKQTTQNPQRNNILVLNLC